jgi:hypothetical protein
MLKLLNGVRSTLVGGNFCLVKGLLGEDLGDEPASFDVGNNLVDDVGRLVFESAHYHHCVEFNKYQ